jgi:hypothetical protein
MADRISLVFFRTATGHEPVREWLKEMPIEDRVQHRWPVGMPLARPLGKGLWRSVSAGEQSHRTRHLLLSRRGAGCAQWLHQEEPENTSRGAPTRLEPKEGVGTMSKKKRHPRHGSTLHSFLKEEGVLEEFRAAAVKEVIAWQIVKAMKDKKLTKNKMAELMQTSRAQLDRLLDPEQGNVTLDTLHRAAHVLGRELRVELS